MAVYVHNITVNQGTTFELDLNVEGTQTNAPKDLTGYSVSADLKKTYTSKTKIAFGATISTPSEGVIQVSLASTVSAEIKPGRYVYDVRVTNPAETLRVVEGTALVRAGVTTA
tara:strand:- start:282 stop:620 length:339 start_codon:yes stop_codon:yes gene_type:complete